MFSIFSANIILNIDKTGSDNNYFDYLIAKNKAIANELKMTGKIPI